jgi:hypothetical protein
METLLLPWLLPNIILSEVVMILLSSSSMLKYNSWCQSIWNFILLSEVVISISSCLIVLENIWLLQNLNNFSLKYLTLPLLILQLVVHICTLQCEVPLLIKMFCLDISVKISGDVS